MEALIGGLIAIVVGQFSILWYKLGKIEGRIKSLNNNFNNKKKNK